MAGSRLLLEILKARVDEIASVPHLNNWWRAREAEIGALTRQDLESLKRHCADRRTAILKGALEDKGASCRGNGQSAAA